VNERVKCIGMRKYDDYLTFNALAD